MGPGFKARSGLLGEFLLRKTNDDTSKRIQSQSGFIKKVSRVEPDLDPDTFQPDVTTYVIQKISILLSKVLKIMTLRTLMRKLNNVKQVGTVKNENQKHFLIFQLV